MSTWMPADSVSQSIVDVALGDAKPDLALNLRHPRPVEWRTLMRGFSQSLQSLGVSREPVPLVDMQAWVKKVATAAEGAGADTLKRIVRATSSHAERC
jgi:hypothetical protein